MERTAIAALIFDMDGTIIDTETPDYESWREIYQAHGLELTLDMWKSRIGAVYQGMAHVFDPVDYFEKQTGTLFGTQSRRLQFESYLERCRAQGAQPGVVALLESAQQRGVPLAVASNSDRHWIDRWLSHLGLRGYFACVSTFEDVAQPKPAPDVYLRAAVCLGVPPEQCLAIEDSPVGMRAALAAGMRCVAVPNAMTAHLPLPDGVHRYQSLDGVHLDELLAMTS